MNKLLDVVTTKLTVKDTLVTIWLLLVEVIEESAAFV